MLRAIDQETKLAGVGAQNRVIVLERLAIASATEPCNRRAPPSVPRRNDQQIGWSLVEAWTRRRSTAIISGVRFRVGLRSILDGPFPGSGCPALSASGPPPVGRTGAAVGCELFVWLDRPITTAVATAPRQAYGSTLNSRLQAHGSEGRAETTLGRNREPNRGIAHWLAFRSQRYNCTAAFTVRAIPYCRRHREYGATRPSRTYHGA